MIKYLLNYHTTYPEKIVLCEGCGEEAKRFDFAGVRLLCNKCMPHGLFARAKRSLMKRIKNDKRIL